MTSRVSTGSNSRVASYACTCYLQMVRQLFNAADGSRRLLAQTPTMIAASTNQTLVVAQPGQITSDPAALTNAFVMIWHCWISSISRIASWDPATGHLVPVGESGDPFFGASGNRYALQNVADLSILAAGQFLFNPTTRVLTYRALPGEDPTNPANITFIAERFSNAVYLSGTSSAPVTNVAFVNLTLSHTAPLLEESCISSGCGDQSDANDPYAALYATYASNITISGVEVAGSGSYGMIFDVGCHDVLVSQCWLHSLGEGGIKVGTGNGGAAANVSSVVHQLTVTDSVIEDSGYIVEAGAGVIVQQAYNVTVAHNHIHHLKYTGVSTGAWSAKAVRAAHVLPQPPCSLAHLLLVLTAPPLQGGRGVTRPPPTAT